MAYDLDAARRAIFAECRRRGLDDDARHQLLREVGRVASGSIKDMGADAARRVLDHLKQKSAPAARHGETEWAFIGTLPPARQPLLRKLAALAGKNGANIARGAQVRYIEGIARQMTGCDKPLPMCDEQDLWRLVAAMSLHVKRRERPAHLRHPRVGVRHAKTHA